VQILCTKLIAVLLIAGFGMELFGDNSLAPVIWHMVLDSRAPLHYLRGLACNYDTNYSFIHVFKLLSIFFFGRPFVSHFHYTHLSVSALTPNTSRRQKAGTKESSLKRRRQKVHDPQDLYLHVFLQLINCSIFHLLSNLHSIFKHSPWSVHKKKLFTFADCCHLSHC